MAVIILDRQGKSKRDYLKWANGFNESIYILGPTDTISSFRYKNAYGFPDFDNNGNVERFVDELSKYEKISRIISFEEGNVIRAASIRENLGIKGQKIRSALLFRDKYKMRKKLKESELKCPHFRRINHFMDIISFIKKVGYPVILKPRKKWASKGVFKIVDENSLNKAISNFDFNDYIIEEYVEGQLYHVDGLFYKSEIKVSCVSKYLENCLESFEDGNGLGSVMINPDSKQANILNDFTKRILKVFDVNFTTLFHAEIFIDRSGNPILCEIGSRIVGGEYSKNIEFSLNINLEEIYLKCELGLSHKIDNNQIVMPSGKVWIPPKKGFIEFIPKINMNYIFNCEEIDYRNIEFNGLQKQMGYLLTISFYNENYEHLEKLAREIKSFYSENIKWSENIVETWNFDK
ncbi:acetyl-CoA carboxylase biotin carboxylase subunit family protein [Staphylococcus sp. HMSC061G12]|uniref:ATP-grasp domain-containing protein n=1 Tax=Staphylococcus sp. HMSC061G12 TaxID=1739441 RepID=UPI0008A98DD7|nr:ATP-grasp domain-containing protein [Staphylococcus sp. HMSC061G12]OHR54285.1 biotin carboxylase [Staphylococcus sp. HMSC061G12]